MRIYPTVDESFERLHRAGWSVGDIATVAGRLITGANGENVIRATGRTQLTSSTSCYRENPRCNVRVSSRTTKCYDCTSDPVSLDAVDKIVL